MDCELFPGSHGHPKNEKKVRMKGTSKTFLWSDGKIVFLDQVSPWKNNFTESKVSSQSVVYYWPKDWPQVVIDTRGG